MISEQELIAEDDEIIQESPEYSPKSDFSKAEMVKVGVQKCMELRAQEMKYGFWNTKLTKDGYPIKEWKPDTRKEFISAVDALRSLLGPEVDRDEVYKKFEQKVKEQAKKIWDDYAYEEMDLVIKESLTHEGGIPVYKKTGKKYMPDVGGFVIIPESSFSNSATSGKGLWDEKVNAYWNGLLTLYDQIFGELNKLIDRNNYFKQAISF